MANNIKAESSSRNSSNPRVTESPQANSQPGVDENRNDSVTQNIKLYNEYRDVLHGIEPVWELPNLDNNVKRSFPGISG